MLRENGELNKDAMEFKAPDFAKEEKKELEIERGEIKMAKE